MMKNLIDRMIRSRVRLQVSSPRTVHSTSTSSSTRRVGTTTVSEFGLNSSGSVSLKNSRLPVFFTTNNVHKNMGGGMIDATPFYGQHLLRSFTTTTISCNLQGIDVDNESFEKTTQEKGLIRTWTKKRLAETTSSYQMKDIMGDIAERLKKQWDLLERLRLDTLRLEELIRSGSNAVENGSGSDGGNNGIDELPSEWWSQMTAERRRHIEEAIELIQKNINSMQRLHRDTERTCRQFHSSLPSSSSREDITPLFRQQLGQACKEVYARHALTIETMAEIVIDFRGILGGSSDQLKYIQSIVLEFLKCRLMTQLLSDHVVDCTMNTERKPTGAISVDVCVRDLVDAAIVEARHLVEGHFIPIADSPQAQVREPPEPPSVIVQSSSSSSSSSSLDAVATVVRPWLQYTLVELLKNSLSATMEREKRDDEVSPYWPIFVELSETKSHVRIQIIDQGGGLLNDQQRNEMDYFEFATRQDKWDRMDDQHTYAMVSSPIRGLGVGLALSRLHVREFGGDLVLENRPESINDIKPGVTMTLDLAKQ